MLFNNKLRNIMPTNSNNRSKQLDPQNPQFYLDRRILLPKAKKLAAEKCRQNKKITNL
jgi:hypothetical protein